jgi:hypothetical protein
VFTSASVVVSLRNLNYSRYNPLSNNDFMASIFMYKQSQAVNFDDSVFPSFPCLDCLIGAQQLLAWCSLHFSGVTCLLRLLEVYGQIKLVASVYWDWE